MSPIDRRLSRAVWREPRRLAWLAILLGASVAAAGEASWHRLPDLPDPEGFAGGYAGVSRGVLLFAGGANFPDRKPWEGGTKVWYDQVFVLDKPDGVWRSAGRLPRPLGYGVSITTDDGVLCIGGSDVQRHYADVFLLEWNNGRLVTSPRPSLPRPCANLSGARLGNTVYVAGGIETPASTSALHTFWSLDLTSRTAAWQELEPWPGPGRMLAVAAVQDGSFFLVSGADLAPGATGQPVRTYLRDAYRFTPGQGWQRVADVPQAVVAAPSPAPAVGPAHFFVLGGDDGLLVDFEPKAEHPGFPRQILAYHTITGSWTPWGEAPAARVTAPTVSWNGRTIVPSGEARPGVRSPQVWGLEVRYRRPPFGWLNYAALFIYLGGMVGIGAWFARRQKTTSDYFKGGGRVPWWAAGLSIYATMLSSITFMSIPAKAYATDWTYVWANLPILLLAPLIVHVYLPFFRELDVTSAYEYLERRFNLAVRLYGSAAFVLFQVGRQAIVLLLPSLALDTITDLNVYQCILLMGLLCVIYTAMGGIEAVIWTDVVQSLVLLGAAMLSLGIIILGCQGGPAGFWAAATSADKFHLANWTLDPRLAANAFWVILGGNLFIALVPYTSDQTVVQRYLTTKDQKKAARAIWTNALLAIPSTLFFFSIGTALWVYYRQHPGELQPALATDAVFPMFIVQTIPAGLAGVVIAGIFAAAQSTVSSSLNSVSTAVVTDFYRRFRPQATDAAALRLARGLTVAVGVVATGGALLLASADVRSLWDTYNALVGLTGSGLAALFLLGITTRRASGWGVLCGAIASAAVLWWVQKHTPLHFLLYAAIGIASCAILGYLASLLLPDRNKDLTGLTLHTRR